MKLEERVKYLNHLLRDAQRVRSKLLESVGDDEVGQTILEEINPWLFGRKCIILPLTKCIDNGNPTDEDVYNFSIIAQRSPTLSLESVISKRKDPILEEIFNDK